MSKLVVFGRLRNVNGKLLNQSEAAKCSRRHREHGGRPSVAEVCVMMEYYLIGCLMCLRLHFSPPATQSWALFAGVDAACRVILPAFTFAAHTGSCLRRLLQPVGQKCGATASLSLSNRYGFRDVDVTNTHCHPGSTTLFVGMTVFCEKPPLIAFPIALHPDAFQ